MHLTELFDPSLVGRASRPAIEYLDTPGVLRTLTFGDVDARANRMAHELATRGLVRGDRLCVHLPNSIAFIDVFLACVRLGVIFVPMNVMYRDREVAHIVGDADPRAVVAAADSDLAYPATVARWNASELLHAASSGPATRPVVALNGATPALIIYTSGTTGAAKGAVLSHHNLIANARNLVECWRITESDRYLAVLPLFHVHGLANGIHAWLASGCFMHLAERFDQRTAAALFAAFRPTLFFGVPTIYVRLLDSGVMSDSDARVAGAAARLFVSGSAPLPVHVLSAFAQRFGHTILERYGMSEALMIASNPYDGERRAGTVGRALPGVSLRLVDESGATVASEESGEVELKSPALFAGYWRGTDATAAAFDDGWFRTGDVGSTSADGYLTLRGRRGDLIISGGFNIYPREIEEVLLEHPGVREAVVVGVADNVRGEIPVAYIVADASLDTAALAARCRAALASFKNPHAFMRLETLPRTALGKVQKQLLPPWSPS